MTQVEEQGGVPVLFIINMIPNCVYCLLIYDVLELKKGAVKSQLRDTTCLSWCAKQRAGEQDGITETNLLLLAMAKAMAKSKHVFY